MSQKLEALLISDAVATAPDGKFTIYGIFDTIHCRKLPVRHPQFSVFWKMYSAEPGEIVIQIKKPDGTLQLSTDPVKISASRISQGVATFGGIEFSVAGDYEILLIFGGSEIVGSTLLRVLDTSKTS